MALLPQYVWPYAIVDAVAAELYLLDRDQLGVMYSYADGVAEAGPLGPDDWPQIRRLNGTGRLRYRTDAARKLAAKLQLNQELSE
jgi:hypothetical protein